MKNHLNVFHCLKQPKQNAYLFVKFFFLLVFFFTGSLQSQNKILSESSKNWKKWESRRVILYFPENFGHLAIRTMQEAYRTIAYYSELFRHDLSHQVIIIIYPSFRDFQSSSILDAYLPEGVLGYTEGFYERVVLPFTGDEEEFFHTLRHELVHSFQFDIQLRLLNGAGAVLPLWFIEGMSEYLSIETGGYMKEYLRDLVLSKRVPDLYSLTEQSGYMNYKVGQSVMYFIHKTWSKEHIITLYKNMLLTKDLQKAFYLTFQMDFFAFQLQWKEFVYSLFEGEKVNELKNPNRLSFRYWNLSKGMNPVYFKPSISADGKYVAFLTYRKVSPVVVIQELKHYTGYTEDIPKSKLIIEYLKDEEFEEWQPLTAKLNFDERYLYIPTRNRNTLAIVQYDFIKGKIQKVHPLPLDTLAEPSISKIDREKLVFTGSIRGFSDVYVLHLKSWKLMKITSDFEKEISPVFSTGGDAVFFIKREGNIHKVYRVHLATRIPEILFGLETEITAIESGYYRIGNTYFEGLYYIAESAGKKQIFFYNFLNKKHYHVVENARDIRHFDIHISKNKETKILYSVIEEGVPEMYVFHDTGEDVYSIAQKKEERNKETLPYSQSQGFYYNLPEENIHLLETGFAGYDYSLYRNLFPFVVITGAVDNRGNSSFALLGYVSLADIQKFHRLDAFVSYQGNPPLLNGEIQYSYSLQRWEFLAGAYSYNGIFVIINPLDLSLNAILYNPYKRLLSHSTSGVYGGIKYKLHTFSAVGMDVDLGRQEQIYAPRLPEERPNQDVFTNYLLSRLYYVYDNAKYSFFGPLEGYAFFIGYEFPVRTDRYYREVYQHVLEFRYYYLFSNFSIFAYRIFLGAMSGRDAKNFPYRIGGYATVRGYEFQKFEGIYAFVMNWEYRFTLVERVVFGFPFRWNLGLIRGAFFLDTGAAFDDYRKFQAFKDGKTYDLKASIGVGIHWSNFLGFLFAGSVMKIEWASPYDGKKTLPFSKWQGRFSIGFNF